MSRNFSDCGRTPELSSFESLPSPLLCCTYYELLQTQILLQTVAVCRVVSMHAAVSSGAVAVVRAGAADVTQPSARSTAVHIGLVAVLQLVEAADANGCIGAGAGVEAFQAGAVAVLCARGAVGALLARCAATVGTCFAIFVAASSGLMHGTHSAAMLTTKHAV